MTSARLPLADSRRGRALRASLLASLPAEGTPADRLARLHRTVLASLTCARAAEQGLGWVDESRMDVPDMSALADAVRALRAAGVDDPGEAHEHLLGLGLRRHPDGRLELTGDEPGERRRRGAHYTPAALARHVVETTLEPLLPADATPAQILALRVADPAMGGGVFLVQACALLAARLVAAWRQHGGAPDGDASQAAREQVARACLFGVDRDALAVLAARWSLWLAVGSPALACADLARSLRHGDAVVDGSFRWERAFASVLAPPRQGFDALIGNPPWVSYAGRARQPLAPARRKRLAQYASFAGYRSLQGVFVERGATLVRPGGRLGFLLPSSMAELGGYAPVRAAHDRECACDRELPDIAPDAFAGVVQPGMMLRSTRRATPWLEAAGEPWPLERPDLDRAARALLDRLAHSPLPPHLFGERGLQTSARDRGRLRPRPDERHAVALRSGSDVTPFCLGAPSQHAAHDDFGPRLRTPEFWRQVRVLIRQTARVPMAALSDGVAFRNSLLAGFADEVYPAEFLVAYLNATPLRWVHYQRHRDARHGIPQMKIGHLRSLPAPSAGHIAPLAALGARLSASGGPLDADAQRALDRLAAGSLDLGPDDLARIWSWARSHDGVPWPDEGPRGRVDELHCVPRWLVPGCSPCCSLARSVRAARTTRRLPCPRSRS